MNEQQNLESAKSISSLSKKSVAQTCLLGDSSRQFFDNPLKKEFLTLAELADFFGVKPTWIIRKVSQEKLACYSIGRSLRLFHIPQLRQAILAGVLDESRRMKHDDSKKKKQNWKIAVSSRSQSQRAKTLQELRDARERRSLGQ